MKKILQAATALLLCAATTAAQTDGTSVRVRRADDSTIDFTFPGGTKVTQARDSLIISDGTLSILHPLTGCTGYHMAGRQKDTTLIMPAIHVTQDGFRTEGLRPRAHVSVLDSDGRRVMTKRTGRNGEATVTFPFRDGSYTVMTKNLTFTIKPLKKEKP